MSHKKAPYSILVIRDTGASPLSVKVGAGWLRFLFLLAAAFLLSLGVFVFYYGKISARFLSVSSVREENARLQARVAELEKLSAEVDKIHALEQKLKALAFKGEEKRAPAPPVEAEAPETPPSAPDPVYDKEIDAFVHSIKLQRNLEFLNAGDDLNKRRQTLASTPNILPVDGWISRGFSDSAVSDRSGHTGIDIAAAVNTPVKAAAPGLVTFAGWKNDLGNMVEIDHGFGFVSRYGHCAQLIANKGDMVDRSQTIALVGNSGRSTGPHLHFEVLKQGVQVDPLEFVLK